MFTRGWSASYKLQNFIQSLLHPYKSKSTGISPGFQHQDGMAKLHVFSMNQGLRLISPNMGIWRRMNTNIRTTKDEKEKDSHSPPASGSGPPKFKFSLWARFLLGSMLSFFLPFWKEKWANLKMIEGEAEMVVEQVENVAEVVEKVAAATEKASAQVAEKLPGDSKLKKVALAVEHVSEITAQDAHATTQFIHEVEAIKQDVDGLESFVGPIVKKILKQSKEPKAEESSLPAK